MEDPFSGLAEPYLATEGTLRGVIRHTLVARQLGEHLPRLPARIVDIGGGAGHQAIPLARKGY
jgi:S-adenosylmethionine-dependent methyltransferase